MPQRACDRCHGIRARCQFNSGQDECERCLRLGHECHTDRKVLKAGRPRKNTAESREQDENISRVDSVQQSHSDEPSLQPQADVLEALRDLDPREVQLAIHFLQNQRFENSFVSDSELSATMQSTPIRLFLSAPGRIKDALLALAGVMMTGDQNSSIINDEETMASMERCCKAMERLRQSDVASVDDAKATLFVATSLISFNDMTMGYGFLPIARATLLSIRPWCDDLVNPQSTDFDPHLIPVLFAEVSECIKAREVPAFRYSSSRVQIIDPSYGISQEVLPYIYDTCVLSRDIKSGLLDSLDLTERARVIYHQVQSWTPKITNSEQFNLSGPQKAKIVSHGECYKVLSILLLHQLQPHVSEGSFNSVDIANQIRSGITSVSTFTRPQIQYLLFPYFVACTEILDAHEQALVRERMEHLSGGIATQSCNRMYEFLQYVWSVRSVDPLTSWFDLVEDGIQFSIGP